jgi:hypothetical protein
MGDRKRARVCGGHNHDDDPESASLSQSCEEVVDGGLFSIGLVSSSSVAKDDSTLLLCDIPGEGAELTSRFVISITN